MTDAPAVTGFAAISSVASSVGATDIHAVSCIVAVTTETNVTGIVAATNVVGFAGVSSIPTVTCIIGVTNITDVTGFAVAPNVTVAIVVVAVCYSVCC